VCAGPEYSGSSFKEDRLFEPRALGARQPRRSRGTPVKTFLGHQNRSQKKAILFKTASSHIEQYLLLTKLEVFLRVSIADTLYYFTDTHHILGQLAFGNILTEQVTDYTAEVLMTRERQEAA